MNFSLSRIDASARAAKMRFSDMFRNEEGAFDLPSILVGVVVVGILTAGVLASIFGVIPFSQDKAAQQDIGSVTTAQGVSKAQNAVYGSVSDLVTAKLLPNDLDPLKIDAKKTASGGWATSSKSASGKVFLSTNVNPAPVDVTGTTASIPLAAPAPGAPVASATGGTLPAGTYYYVFTSIANGETVRSNEVSVTTTGTTSSVSLSWTTAPGSINVGVYRSTTPGAETKLIQTNGSAWIDTGFVTPNTSAPPATSAATYTATINSVASALATK